MIRSLPSKVRLCIFEEVLRAEDGTRRVDHPGARITPDIRSPGLLSRRVSGDDIAGWHLSDQTPLQAGTLDTHCGLILRKDYASTAMSLRAGSSPISLLMRRGSAEPSGI